MGSLATAYAVFGVSRLVPGAPATVQAATLPGMASLTGTVDAPAPFTGAQVYLRNVDKRILHMVYTQAGRFRATPLFPGSYEISVVTKGLASDVQRVVLKPGDNPAVKLSLRPSTGQKPAGSAASGDVEADSNAAASQITETATFEEIYPPGPGRDIAERTCIMCHGENFLPTKPASRASWETRINHMMGAALATGPATSYAQGLLTYRTGELGFSREDRETFVNYVTEHFGPRAKPRKVRVSQEMPYDEAQLGKAMYIEYYLPDDPPGQGVHAPEYNSLKAPFCCGRRVGQDVRFDDAGNVWLTDRGYPHRLVRLNPATAEQKTFQLPDGAKGGIHDITIDKSGIVWVPEHSGAQPSVPKRLLGLNSKTEKWEHAIPLDPDNVARYPIKWAQSLTLDSKGNVYVGWMMGGILSKYDRATKKVTVFPAPEHNAIIYGVVADRNDNIFVALWNLGHIGKFDTHNNQWTIYTPPTHPGHTRRMQVDAQNNVWWGIWSAGRRPAKLAKLDQATGVISEITIPRQNAQPYDVSPDSDGNLWVVDGGGAASSLYRYDPRTQKFTLYPKPQAAADSPKIQVTKEGAVWYSPRGSQDAPGFGVLFPDMDKITTLAARYASGPPGTFFDATRSTSR
jgi:streptogramin lyase/cytochrome c5